MEDSLILQQQKDLKIEQTEEEKKSAEPLLIQKEEEAQLLPQEEQREQLFRSVHDNTIRKRNVRGMRQNGEQ